MRSNLYDKSDMKTLRTITQTADETGLSTDTLRYYERIGLITDIARAENGHRRYSEQDIVWILFLKQLRATGMAIAQMQEFAQLRRGGDATIVERRQKLEEHRADLQAQVDRIIDFMSVIDLKIARHKENEQHLFGEKAHDKHNVD